MIKGADRPAPRIHGRLVDRAVDGNRPAGIGQ